MDHFFDLHFLDAKGVEKAARSLKQNIEFECNLATRFGILCSRQLFLPAASFFESPLCNKLIRSFEDIYGTGAISLIGGGGNVEGFIEEKLRQYARNSTQFERYSRFQSKPQNHPPFYPRKQSATKDITVGWLDKLNDGITIPSLWTGTGQKMPRRFEQKWSAIPEMLQSNAFIVEHVNDLLFTDGTSKTITNRLHTIINEEYFASFTRELIAGTVSEMVYLEPEKPIASFAGSIPYKSMLDCARRAGLLPEIQKASGLQLFALKNETRWLDCYLEAVAESESRSKGRRQMMQATTDPSLAEAQIGIITALPEEFAAVQLVLGETRTVSAAGTGAGRRYLLATLRTTSGSFISVAIALMTDMGNNQAAIRAAAMLTHCPNVKHIIMCGIAGAVPNSEKAENHVRLGDIVVSDRNGVIQYDLTKETPTQVIERYPPRPPAAVLLETHKHLIAGELQGDRPWLKELETTLGRVGQLWQRPMALADVLQETEGGPVLSHPDDERRQADQPRLFAGAIASANILLKNPAKRNYLRDKFGVRAVEMEASGIADATWNSGDGYFVVRGMCDYCNGTKGDAWHNYAALVAACYTKVLILETQW